MSGKGQAREWTEHEREMHRKVKAIIPEAIPFLRELSAEGITGIDGNPLGWADITYVGPDRGPDPSSVIPVI